MKLHPNAPKDLKRLFRSLRSCRAIARERKVNPRYVWELLANGRAPSNPEIGRRLFVHYEPIKRVPVGDGRRRHTKWWRRLTATQRDQAIDFLYHYREGENPGQNNHAI